MEDCPSLDDEDCDGLINEEGLSCVCVPGQKLQCHSGPPQTQFKGNCQPGWVTCATDGMSYGPCVGEVLPSQEDCDETYTDEDCDGQTNEEGPSCVCAPGQLASTCYTGPSAKLGVGSCQAGKLMCKFSGLGFYETCYNEVLPVLENCAAPSDEDCNGQTAPPCAQPLWAKTLPPGSGARVDTLGTGVWVAGSANQATDLGGGVLPAGAPSDVWVARFDADGKHVWSRQFPGPGNESVQSLAVGGSGESVVAGWCSGSAVFDSVGFDCKKSGKVFVLKLAATGAVLWAKAFGPDGASQVPSSVEMDAAGNVIFAGIHHDSIDFGGGPLPKPAMEGSTFLVKLDPNGNHAFSKSFPHQISYSVSSDWVADVAATGAGDVIVSGKFMGSFDLGGGTLGSGWGYKAYVGRFDSNGAHQWSKAWESSLVSRMRTTAAGTIFLAGAYDSPIAFGPTPLPGNGRFVVELAADGKHIWSSGSNPGYNIEVKALGVRAGSPIILGGAGGYFDFGFGQTQSLGGFLVGLESGGNALWQYPENKVFHAAAYDSMGNLYVLGPDFLRKIYP